MGISEKLEKILFRKPTYVDEGAYIQFAQYVMGDYVLNISTTTASGDNNSWICVTSGVHDGWIYDLRFDTSSSELYDVYHELLGNAIFNEME